MLSKVNKFRGQQCQSPIVIFGFILVELLKFELIFLKGMVSLMVDSTTSMLRIWENRIKNEGGVADIKVDEDLRSLSGDIISRACFGSSYSQGEQIFSKLRTLQKLMSNRIIGIPFLRY